MEVKEYRLPAALQTALDAEMSQLYTLHITPEMVKRAVKTIRDQHAVLNRIGGLLDEMEESTYQLSSLVDAEYVQRGTAHPEEANKLFNWIQQIRKEVANANQC